MDKKTREEDGANCMQEQNENRERGMLTIEVIFFVTMLAGFSMLLLNYFNLIYLKQKMQAALTPIALQIAGDYYIDDSIADGGNAQERAEISTMLKKRRLSFHNMTPASKSKNNMKEYVKEQLLLDMSDFTIGYSKRNYADMWIVGGYDGISFARTRIKAGDPGDVIIGIDYKVRLVNIPFLKGAGINVKVSQTASTRVWRK